MERKTFSVAGMACDGCEQNVRDALTSVDGVSEVDADHETDTVEVVGDADDDEVQTAIEDAGYDVADA